MGAAAPAAAAAARMMPPITFETEHVPAPAPLYITRDDVLVLRVRNSVAGINVTCRGRYLGRDGLVHRFSEFVVPTSARAANDLQIELDCGFLLSVTVSVAETDVVRRGQTFVQVFLQHGAVEVAYQQLLVSDYVTQMAPVGWPGGILRSSVEGPGMLRSITGTDPAAGAEISETVPVNARWRLDSLRATLVADATVITRSVTVIVDDGATALMRQAASAGQTAGQTIAYNVTNLGYLPGLVGGEGIVPLQLPIPLFQGFRVRTSTALLQAGDNWGPPQLLVEEWIEE